MGIISTLLTGGGILGKICQTIQESGIFHMVNSSDGSQIMLKIAKDEINGVRFTEIEKDGATVLSAFNTDVDMYAMVTYPNGYGKTDGFQLFIPPMKTCEIALGDWNLLSPDLPVYVQKIDLSGGGLLDNNRVIIAFQNMELNGNTLKMPNTTLTATLIELTVSFATAGLGDLATAEFCSLGGVKATLRDPIQHIDKGMNYTSYKIPFGDLGYIENDSLSGIMQFKIDNETAKLIKLSADKAATTNGLDEVSRFLCNFYKIG